MLSDEMYLNWNLVLQATLLKKRRIDAKLIQTNDLNISIGHPSDISAPFKPLIAPFGYTGPPFGCF